MSKQDQTEKEYAKILDEYSIESPEDLEEMLKVITRIYRYADTPTKANELDDALSDFVDWWEGG